MRTLKITLLSLVVILTTAFTPVNKKSPVTVFMIGDSTMANKNLKNGNLERGWGMVLRCYFDDDVIIDNHSVNGKSSKSFINEGRWARVLEKLKAGDYVIIQFGHNDEKAKPDRHTVPGTSFDDNLRKFVRETREAGGIPILMNSVVRRNFKEAKKSYDDEALRNTSGTNAPLEEGMVLIDTHGDYLNSPRNVADEMGVLFVDANKITHDLEQALGPEGSKKLHMWFLPGEEPSVPKGRQDNTHYNVYGAHAVAKLLANAIADSIPFFKEHLVDCDYSVSTSGCGNYFSLEEAMANAPSGRKVKIQLFEGEWKKPKMSKSKQITFHLRNGASLK